MFNSVFFFNFSLFEFIHLGDAVNVASRMDSTGVAGRIQVTKDCIPFLNDQLYEFEPRGNVFVKGKDNMLCGLVKRKRLDT